MSKRIVIIGGGIAGLSAGIFARQNGFETLILEKNRVLGGECTGWDRAGYHIDGCIHWLVGTLEGTPINRMWQAVGALEDVDIYHPESFLSFEYGGETVHFYRDLDRLESSWRTIAPEDSEAIAQLCKDIRLLQDFEIPVDKPTDLMGPLEKGRLMLSMREAGTVMRKYGKTTVREFARTFSHPALRAAVAAFLPEGYSASSIIFALAAFTKGQASIPVGGSRAFAARMVQRYRDLGGRTEAPCEVVRLEREGNRAIRAVSSDGRSFDGDYFVAACDAHFFWEVLLEGEYPDPAFSNRFSNPETYPLASQVTVALGYEGRMEDVPRSLSFPVRPFRVLGDAIERLNVTHFAHETDFAPPGHTVITCAINQFAADWQAWKSLSDDRETYRATKERIGETVAEALATRFPEMTGRLRVLDVATPLTHERYCNAHQGAFMAFLPTISGKGMEHDGRVKGLKNAFLTDQWLQPPGGLPVALITGKDTIMRICRKERRDFRSFPDFRPA